ncbi:MAG: hypothetical protein ACFFBD_03080 [Candidatus Hodarchaeota archaeon]
MKNTQFQKGTLEITRNFEGIQFLDSTLTKEMELKVIKTLNAGNPKGFFTLIIQEGEETFFFKFQGTSTLATVNILVTNSEELEDAVIFYPEVQSLDERIGPNTVSNYLLPFADLGLKNLDGLLFAILTAKPVFIIGAEEEIAPLVFSILSFLPPEIAKKRSLITHTESISQKMDFIGLTGEGAVKLSTQWVDTATVVVLSENRIYSPYECPLTKQLAELILTKQSAKVSQLLADIYQKSWSIRSQPLEDVAEELDCPKANGEFYFLVAKTIDRIPSLRKEEA